MINRVNCYQKGMAILLLTVGLLLSSLLLHLSLSDIVLQHIKHVQTRLFIAEQNWILQGAATCISSEFLRTPNFHPTDFDTLSCGDLVNIKVMLINEQTSLWVIQLKDSYRTIKQIRYKTVTESGEQWLLQVGSWHDF